MAQRTLSFASFNLYNLNRPGQPMYGDRDGWPDAVVALKTRWTSHLLRLLASDVVGFQELWHPQPLAQAVRDAGLDGDTELLVPPGTAGGHIVCAALVRRGLRVGEPEWIADFPPGFRLQAPGDDPQTPAIAVAIRGFSRPVLHLQIRPVAREPAIHVYVCHFKSKALTRIDEQAWYRADPAAYRDHRTALGSALSTIRRTAEAAALRFLLTAQMKRSNTPVVVLGDLNDGQLSNTLNVLTEQPRYLAGDRRGGGDTALYAAQTLQLYRDTRDVYYTHVHQDLRESLDHVLVSEQFYDHSRRRLWVFDGMTVNNDHLNADDHGVTGTNDHGIVRVQFRHSPARR